MEEVTNQPVENDFKSIFTNKYRFKVFLNMMYYPYSGFKNYIGQANDLEELKDIFREYHLDYQDIVQIIDLESNKLFEYELNNYGANGRNDLFNEFDKLWKVTESK